MPKAISIFLSLAAILAASRAEAAMLRLNPDSIRPGESSWVEILLDTEGEELNAAEGEIVLPPGLSANDISDGGSIFSVWLEKPQISKGVVRFSGLVPGGFSGRGVLFALSISPDQNGIFPLNMESVSFYANDGSGSLETPSGTSTQLAVSDTAPRGAERDDRDPPESFVPEIARKEGELDGNWFLVFAATDKISGIDHYEVLEVPAGRSGRELTGWVRAESPHILMDQSRRSDTFVRAVDKAGNFRIVQVPAAQGSNQQLLYVALFVGLVCLMVMRRAYRAYRTWRSAP